MEADMTAYNMRSTSDPMIPYCAMIRRDGFKPVLYGTIVCPADTGYADVERMILNSMAEHGLDGFSIEEIRRGSIVWVPHGG